MPTVIDKKPGPKSNTWVIFAFQTRGNHRVWTTKPPLKNNNKFHGRYVAESIFDEALKLIEEYAGDLYGSEHAKARLRNDPEFCQMYETVKGKYYE